MLASSNKAICPDHSQHIFVECMTLHNTRLANFKIFCYESPAERLNCPLPLLERSPPLDLFAWPFKYPLLSFLSSD